jgi:uncharacterized protein
MSGDIVYFVIPAGDADRAKTFYGELFDWRFAPGNVPGGYQLEGPNPPGGLFEGGKASSPEVYFGVDDIDAAVARVRALGGEADDPSEIASGFMARCTDDQGVSFGLWAPKA